MKISIVTLFPKMISGFFEESIIKRAKEKKLVEIELVNLRDFAENAHRSVDDKPYGGGAGMVMRVDIVSKAVESLKKKNSKVVLTSAKGKQFGQKKAEEFSKLDHLIIIAGHYEGADARVGDFIDEEVSVGDFILTGGELTAAMVVDAVVRLLPGVLKKEEATQEESFFAVDVEKLINAVGQTDILTKLKNSDVTEVQLLEYPHYTRPETFQEKKVPGVLLSGNHKEIEKWRLVKAYEETVKKRPDLLKNQGLTKK
ncbi:tRNA (guanosine(37)-N1)-methyltransferase TrmD [Candidatus Roizmanbacteria bacterium RIFCSPLOWO2_12_FULL_40_12]|uniref:tRNA (guanine-N(1)-)-methyltransferase n=1 Tax=Candidatus Roizmanbacteria bacterium RIFCSPLOWO2_01_FULL_40_42 TaxID=1802066 RepID=A0A1F7J619_9BACT|nr:MAG: tRNA (guanosine(37)-N1)-methyltransferase TrmD [Candidatus Roizmanbacteria bacterium RIFCSPHIGHO2_01_FULL_40_98]OGK27855.1 MAG: tRNA (guanosine(37)-N1)-methyltransferase TrmD [Candidatus Roizmanbacteria bacterium RIFCSPHIGHO2_02_FULL_40_53]OGK29405.1 MAG: tRNA (guanosine(37)-N1)-methyltransferase TrmD [Candidatus Roizmanbacteria bacterium RIFCSPHIGHO2_12_41_18]OGK36608.1 MAG: tRNA (guanosine(37)-N1)-methyltransferase TrmD [Candidatus Roizmanbacteria bacterium RIFCSPHIGHO2_12_FULL_40_130]